MKLHCLNMDAAHAALILNGARFCDLFKNAEADLEGEIILCRVNQNDPRPDAAPSAVASRVAKTTGIGVATIRKRRRTEMPTGNIWFLIKVGATQGRHQHQVSAVRNIHDHNTF